MLRLLLYIDVAPFNVLHETKLLTCRSMDNRILSYFYRVKQVFAKIVLINQAVVDGIPYQPNNIMYV